MPSLWRRTVVSLGLVDDDEYDYDDYDDSPAVRPLDRGDRDARDARPGDRGFESREPIRAESSRWDTGRADTGRHENGRYENGRDVSGIGAVRTMARDEAPSGSRPTVIRTMASAAPKVHVVEPTGFNDAQEVGDRLKAGQPVILNLQGLDRALQRRLVDFSSGLAYALNGTMSKAAEQVFLLAPANVEVSQEEKARLRTRGLYHED